LPITVVIGHVATDESIREDDATIWVVTGVLEERIREVTLRMDDGMLGDQYTNKETILYRCNTEGYLPMNVLREGSFE
jgi:hypothetical protein